MIALLLLALALAACADGAPPAGGPRLAFRQRQAAVGPLAPGAAASHSFAFRNDGGRPLRFSSLRTGCGCRAEVTPSDVIPAGGSGAVELACETDACARRARHTVTVYSNDASQPAVLLELAAPIDADITARQPELYFGKARPGERLKRDIRLELVRPEASPRSARSESGVLAPALERRNDGEWRVALTLSPEAPAGVVRDRIVIETASARQPRLVVPVEGRVVGSTPE